MFTKQKSFSFGRYVPNDKVLNRKVPENPRYKHVQPAIDTGQSVRKHIDDLKEKQKYCNHRKDEVFKRIRINLFINLALAEAELRNNEYDTDNQDNVCNGPEAGDSSSKRCYANVLMGIGELDLQNSRKKVQSSPKTSGTLPPYLLLDVRDRDAFSKCHIKTAKPYPSAMLSRAGYETEDMKLYKNCAPLIIILYDDDETIGTRVATTLVERGYENVYLLTGGLRLALEICPHGLTTSSQLSPVHMIHNEASTAQRSIPKECFSEEDIRNIRHCVDTYPRSNKNSISSTASSRSRTRSVGSRCSNGLASSASTSTSSRRVCPCSSSSTHQRQPSLSRQSSCSSSNIHQRQSSLNRENSCSSNIHQRQPSINRLNSKQSVKKSPWK